MITHNSQGILFVISSPTCAGKSTLSNQLLASDERLQYSVSCTTRPPREGEEDGVHYHFLSEEVYAEKVAEGAFLEHARVHDFGYGTLRETVEGILSSGDDVLMDLDVQGTALLRGMLQREEDLLCSRCVDIFIAPPSLAVLEERLRARAEDSEEVMALRLRNARIELAEYDSYKYLVINDQFDDALFDLRAIVRAERICLC